MMPSFIKPYYFWDIDLDSLDLTKSEKLIIKRVFTLGSIEDIRELLDYYGENKVLDVLMRVNYLDAKTLNLAVKLFNKDKREFRCYIRSQSIDQHWS